MRINLYFSYLLLIILLFAGCSDSKKKTESVGRAAPKWETITQDQREYDKASENKIKVRRTVSYFYNANREVAGKGYLVEELFFDENGLRKEQIRYFSNGRIDLKWSFNYDDSGNLLQAETVDEWGRVHYSRKSVYEEGREISREEYDIQQKQAKYMEFEYFGNDLLAETKIYDTEENFEGSQQYEYEGDYLIKKNVFGKNSNLTTETVFFYDENRNKIKEIKYSPPTFRDTIDYRYDASGNLTVLDAGYYKQEFTYDDKGNVIAEKFISKEGYLQQLITYVYDFRGLLTEKVKHDGEEVPVLLITYQYEFY